MAAILSTAMTYKLRDLTPADLTYTHIHWSYGGAQEER